MNWCFPTVLDYMSMWARAAAAERYYEENKRTTSAGGGANPLTRWSLHRAVFDKLTGRA